MKHLLIGDLHLTDRSRDAYRFSIFNWIRKQQIKYRPEITFLMGDLTDKKDNHSSVLVNRIIRELVQLEPPVFILKGNHDYINEEDPFFKFLNEVHDGYNFVTSPTKYRGVMMIPHYRQQAQFEEALKCQIGFDILLIHQTIDGTQAESGARLSGFRAAPIASLKGVRCYAGDVHKPQRSGPVTYVGAPYTIRFGDDFQPRCLLLDEGKEKNLYFDCLKKWSLTVSSPEDIIENEDLLEGDQVKLTLKLPREELVNSGAIKKAVKQACEEKGLEVFGIETQTDKQLPARIEGAISPSRTPQEIITAYAKQEKLPSQVKQVGLELCSTLKESS